MKTLRPSGVVTDSVGDFARDSCVGYAPGESSDSIISASFGSDGQRRLIFARYGESAGRMNRSDESMSSVVAAIDVRKTCDAARLPIASNHPARHDVYLLSDVWRAKVEWNNRMNLDWLIHAPWWAAALVIAAGAAIFWSGNQRRDATMSRVGIALTIIGLVLGIVAYVFPSDRQKMEARAKGIIRAVDKGDWKQMADLLDEHTTVATIAMDVAAGREVIVRNAHAQMEMFKVSGITVLSTQTTQVDTDITVLMKVGAKSEEILGEPFIIDCQFDFEKSGEKWLLGKITILRAGGANGDEVLIHRQMF
jgi:hypothetical protein